MRPEPYPRLLLTEDDKKETILAAVPLIADGRNEAWLRDFLMRCPEALPCAEIDPAFADPIPVCTELRTAAGPLDGFLVTPSGRIVLLECKLWRNPQARREVVGQILDYAKELARWDYARLQAAVASRLGKAENPLFAHVLARRPDLDEARFVDGIERTLRDGRFLLLIAGDGIQQGAQAIVEYLQEHATLRFSLGLMEVRGYRLPDGRLLVQPRILVRTELIERTVFMPTFGALAAPDASGYSAQAATELPDEPDDDRRVSDDADRLFMSKLSEKLQFDDPSQPLPRWSGPRNARARLVVPDIWVTVYRASDAIGTFIRFRGPVGRGVFALLATDMPAISAEFAQRLPGEITLKWGQFSESRNSGYIEAAWKGAADAASDEVQLEWLARACPALVNTIRFRIQAALDTLADTQGKEAVLS
jgi:hypothetical protein